MPTLVPVLFGQRMMVEADHAGDLPCVALVLPEHDELRLSYIVVVTGVMEAVRADLDGTVVGEGIDLQRSGHKFSGDFAADIALDAGDERLASAGETGSVVVELEVFGDKGCESGEVAMVVGVEEFGVERLDGLEERIGCGGGLCSRE